MPTPLDTILAAIRADAGLRASVPLTDINGGIAAAADLNRVLLAMIDLTNGNDDRLITASDMQAVSDALWRPANAQAWRDFYVGHGNDNGTIETGYHHVQDDGGTLEFRGRSFLDTVADAIYHYGFKIENGRYANEDGNDNERTADVAGWLNFFLNGRSMVYGSGAADSLGSGTYSAYFAAARSETFMGYGGNDSLWADVGNDKVYGGSGHDVSGLGDGNDTGFGDGGNDTLYGEDGNDRLNGWTGTDDLNGGTGNDVLFGGADRDSLCGNEGGDTLEGGADGDTLNGQDGRDYVLGGDGWDSLTGGDGADTLRGGTGRDTLSGHDGADRLRGEKGADEIYLWEGTAASDTIVLAPGDSGRQRGEIDMVEGFVSGTDKIDLTAWEGMRFNGSIDFYGGDRASCYFDGTYLRIDGNGDRATDMMVEFRYVDRMTAADFILG